MSIKRHGKDLSARYWGKKVVVEVRKGLRLQWMLGNFFTKDNNIFATRDGDTFFCKDN